MFIPLQCHHCFQGSFEFGKLSGDFHLIWYHTQAYEVAFHFYLGYRQWAIS
jgi:hypothetical protein